MSPSPLANRTYTAIRDRIISRDSIDFDKLNDDNKKFSQLLKSRDGELSSLAGTSDEAFRTIWQGHRVYWKNLTTSTREIAQVICEYYRGIELVLQNAIVTRQAIDDCKKALQYYLKDQASLLFVMESWAATMADGIQHSLHYKPFSGGKDYNFEDASGTVELFYGVFQNFSTRDKEISQLISEIPTIAESDAFVEKADIARQSIRNFGQLLGAYNTRIHTYDDDDSEILPTH